MLNFFVSTPQGLTRVADTEGVIPSESVWIDLLNPTSTEETLVERTLAVEVPTREEMKEIEASNRLYEDGDALYMTVTVVTKLDSEQPENSQITFILAKNRLITNRYADPLPFQRFIAYAEKHPTACASPAMLLAGLVEAIVNRMADVLERIGTDLDQLSTEVFNPPRNGRRARLAARDRDSRAILVRVGQNGDLTSKARESLVSLGRLLAFVQQSLVAGLQNEVRGRFRTLSRDVMALSDHASYLGSKATFLLEATLGLINLEQNNIIKIFSVVAVMLMPPTLIASIYGMNFVHIPWLHESWGFLAAIVMMLLSSVIPYLFFKRRGWL